VPVPGAANLFPASRFHSLPHLSEPDRRCSWKGLTTSVDSSLLPAVARRTLHFFRPGPSPLLSSPRYLRIQTIVLVEPHVFHSALLEEERVLGLVAISTPNSSSFPIIPAWRWTRRVLLQTRQLLAYEKIGELVTALFVSRRAVRRACTFSFQSPEARCLSSVPVRT